MGYIDINTRLVAETSSLFKVAENTLGMMRGEYANKNRRNENLETQTEKYFSHVPRIAQTKNLHLVIMCLPKK